MRRKRPIDLPGRNQAATGTTDSHQLSQLLAADTPSVTRDLRGVVVGINQAAAYLGVTRQTVWRYAREGKIKSLVMGTDGRPQFKFLEADVLAFQRELEEQRSRRSSGSLKRQSRETKAYLRLARQMLASGQISLDKLMNHPGSKHVFEL